MAALGQILNARRKGDYPVEARADDTGMPDAEVDPRISYPCYKSLDEFIDVEKLKSLAL